MFNFVPQSFEHRQNLHAMYVPNMFPIKTSVYINFYAMSSVLKSLYVRVSVMQTISSWRKNHLEVIKFPQVLFFKCQSEHFFQTHTNR